MYLIVAKYADDAERKRIEYVFEKWRERMGIEKPEGIAVIAKEEDISEMLEELYSKLRRENIRLYSLEEPTLDIKKEKRELTADIEGSVEAVEKFIGFIMAKHKATLKRSLGEMGKVYESYTRKGRVQIIVRLKKAGAKVNLFIEVEGFGEATAFIHGKIKEDLTYLKAA